MPEMKKRIVIASVLKPVSDTRMAEKIAATLAQDETMDVHVIGYPTAYFPNEKITVHSFAPFARISFKRFTTPLKILRIIRKVKPSVLIVTTHELLGTALLAKLLTSAKVVYDVQENYYLNILHTKAFDSFIKYPIAAFVRLKEIIARTWVDHFFLAEEIYAKQLRFTRGKTTVLENKAKDTLLPQATHIRNPRSLLFSGTLSESTGVFEAITLAKALYKIEPETTLTIIGFAAIKHELERIRFEVSDLPFIRLIGGSSLVNHQEIVQTITECGAGIIAYELNPATEGRTPTKLFEYIAGGLPIIFTRGNRAWEQLAFQARHPFFVVTSSPPTIQQLRQWLVKSTPRGTVSKAVYWKTEEIKLKTAISALLK